VSDCRDFRTELGAHALGLLDDADAGRVEEHLTECSQCEAELDELLGTSALLLSMPAPAPSAQRRRLLGGAAGAAGVIAAVAIALAVTLGGRPVDPQPPRGPQIAMRAAAPGAAGTVRLSARPWGTQIDLTASRLPAVAAGDRYDIWLTAADGRRVPAGTCRPAGGSATMRMRLGAAIRLKDVTAVGISRAGDPAGLAVLRAAL
jgi:hypothetical protein